ncbi:hypothetical protein [Nonomuraea salmonea]|uniref:hypothetical protein n=1 Tax=Nonomuraea salmonea TaxID=46181 RepID=UPI002FEB00A4
MKLNGVVDDDLRHAISAITAAYLAGANDPPMLGEMLARLTMFSGNLAARCQLLARDLADAHTDSAVLAEAAELATLGPLVMSVPDHVYAEIADADADTYYDEVMTHVTVRVPPIRDVEHVLYGNGRRIVCWDQDAQQPELVVYGGATSDEIKADLDAEGWVPRPRFYSPQPGVESRFYALANGDQVYDGYGRKLPSLPVPGGSGS